VPTLPAPHRSPGSVGPTFAKSRSARGAISADIAPISPLTSSQKVIGQRVASPWMYADVGCRQPRPVSGACLSRHSAHDRYVAAAVRRIYLEG